MPPRRESTAKNFLVTALVALVCSLAVSLAEVALRPYRAVHADVERLRGVLEAAGELGESLERAAERVESRVVDLETGAYVPDDEADFEATTELGDGGLEVGLDERPRYVRVWLVRRRGAVEALVLPVSGRGWSPLKGLLGLDRDLRTIRGLVVVEHGETAGMGAEIDKPAWKAQWPGKRALDAGGAVVVRVVKPGSRPRGVDPSSVVDGVSGASLTTEGIDAMVRFWLGQGGFGRYLDRLRREGVDRE